MAKYYTESPAMVIQQGKKVKYNPILMPIAAIAIYSMIIPIFILDIWTRVYQFIYFSINDIPKIKKSDYVSIERWDLKALNIWQKINCVYCEYVNGTTAWAKAVANQTEIYSCAIKHKFLRVHQEHERDYFDSSKFE